jgi:hypothetical protein
LRTATPGCAARLPSSTLEIDILTIVVEGEEIGGDDGIGRGREELRDRPSGSARR